MVRLTLAVLLAVGAALASAQERPSLHTVLIDGQPLTFADRDGLAVVDGDMIAGHTADFEAASGKSNARAALLGLNSLGNPQLWPQATIYYTVDITLPNQQRVIDAVAYWNNNTPLKLQPRVGQTDYVRFSQQTGNCTSSVGRIGGQQVILLDDACSTGNVIHEIGHAFGLLHEQSRNDRNTFVTVQYENIDTTYFSQYGQTRNSRDLGYYDYDSTMHYSTTGFSYNGRSTQVSSPPGIPIGQRTGLSANDIDAISRVYGIVPAKTTVTTIPEGLTVVVDGQSSPSPVSFDWLPGTQHRIGVADNQALGGTSRYRYVRWTDAGDMEHTFRASEDRTVVAAEFQQRVRLNITAQASGTVLVEPPSPDGYYVVGTDVRITARANAGQQFLSWNGSTFTTQGFGSGAETLNVELNANTTLVAIFSSQPVTVIDSAPSGRQVLVDGLTYTTPIRFAWTPGSSHTLNVRVPQYSATSSTKYRFAGWEDGTTEALRTVIAGASATYRVKLGEQHYLDFTRSGGSGTTSIDPPQDSSYVDAGTTVELRVAPGFGQTVQYWLGDVAGTATSRTILMDRPKRAVAVVGPALPFRVVHAGSYSTNPSFEQPGAYVAPLELVTLFGTGVGPATLTSGTLNAAGLLTTEAGGTRVLFDGLPAPVLNTSATQTSVFVPAEVAGKASVTITLERNGQPAGSATYNVSATLPGLFTVNASGSGQAVAINADGSFNSKDRPAAPGSFVVLYATGGGLMDRAFANGQVADGNLSSPQSPVYARIGKESADVYYAGSAPGLVSGVMQLNVRIPETMAAGEWPLRVVMGNAASVPGVTISVK